MIATTDIKRPAVRWYGGKWNLAAWIIDFFPDHLNYLEPCFGAGSVLFQKPRSRLETVNDLDGDVTNFFRVLRDQRGELIKRIELTPWARLEYEESLTPCQNEMERARRFWARCWMSINGTGEGGSGFRVTTEAKWDPTFKPGEASYLYDVSDRWMGVQIETRDALEFIKNYDNEDTLIYFDPPYLPQTRTKAGQYRIEQNRQFHINAASVLLSAAGFVIVSGYASPLYADLYEAHGWQRHDVEAQTNSGGKRIESLWLSPRTTAALNQPEPARQGSLFDG